MKVLECFLCCISFCGCKDQLTRSVAFYPPRPSGYRLFKSGKSSYQIILLDEHGSIVHPIQIPWIKVSILSLPTSFRCHIPSIHFQNVYSELTLIFAHGNSTDIGLMYNYIADLAMQLKVSVLLFEYSGYGEATGKPSEQHLYSDIRAAYNYLLSLDVPWQSIVLYGHSIGSAAVCDLAVRQKVAGVVLHSPLASGLHFISDTPKKSAWYNAFPNIKKIGLVSCPVFIMHGTEDTEIPISHGQSLAAELANPWPAWFPDAGHNDIEEKYRKVYLAKMGSFLASIALNKENVVESGFESVAGLQEVRSLSIEVSSSKLGKAKVSPENRDFIEG
jgi:abhydrolase domain-containing protein 17